MTEVVITGRGSNVETVIANMREQLDAQFADRWHLIDEDDDSDESVNGVVMTMLGGNPAVSIELSDGGHVASVTVTMRVQAELLAAVALPRTVRA